MATLIDKRKQELEFGSLLFWSVQAPRVGNYLHTAASLLTGIAVAAMLGLSLVWQPAGEVSRIMAAVAGIAGFLYIALAVDTENPGLAGINVVTGILVFSLALMALNGSILWLAGAFLVHLGWAAIELWRQPNSLTKHWLILSWAGFNLGNMFLLLLGR